MSKAFSQEETTFEEDEAPDEPSPLPVGARNYMTPGGFARLKGELDRLTTHDRPELVATVAWAASNGDRSLIRSLGLKIQRVIIDPGHGGHDTGTIGPSGYTEKELVLDIAKRLKELTEGATVTIRGAGGDERTVSIVGIDEIDTARGYISWVSPMARALLKAREGETVVLRTPAGVEELEVIAVRYAPLATGGEATTAG